MNETPQLSLPEVTIRVTDETKPRAETLITETYEKIINYYTNCCNNFLGF